MSIVKMYNKKSGITYVYESESYWDKEKQQPRNKRKLIGKLDPITNEVIPTGRASRNTELKTHSDESVSDDLMKLKYTIEEKDREISELKTKVLKLELQCKRYEDIMDRIRSIIDQRKG